MSSIEQVGSAGPTWAAMSGDRASRMKDRLFEKADADGSGAVDGKELKSMLADMARRSGQSAPDADPLMSQLDSDGNGSLDKNELAQGLRSLLPKHDTTQAFAQHRSDGKVERGPPPAPPPGPPPADGSTDGTTTDVGLQALMSTLDQVFKAADTDGDNTLSNSESTRLKQVLTQALGEGRGTAPPAEDRQAAAKANPADALAALMQRVLQQYASTAASASGGALSLIA